MEIQFYYLLGMFWGFMIGFGLRGLLKEKRKRNGKV